MKKMDQLNKLIEQYEKETEYNAMQEPTIGDVYTFRFVEWLASRPTCGVEQRKFLDEIERKFDFRNSEYSGSYLYPKREHLLEYNNSEMMQGNFVADLQKVKKGE